MLRRIAQPLRFRATYMSRNTSTGAGNSSVASGNGAEFKMEPMTAQSRSAFPYRGSEKGGEVGARNEAAFMNYESFNPKSVTQVLGTAHVINLLTVLPAYAGAFVVGSFAWGIFFWDMHSKKHYESIKIERP